MGFITKMTREKRSALGSTIKDNATQMEEGLLKSDEEFSCSIDQGSSSRSVAQENLTGESSSISSHRRSPSVNKISGRRYMKQRINYAQRLKKRNALIERAKETDAFARDKIFTIGIFFASTSTQLWNPPGGVNSEGLAQAKGKPSYLVFEMAMGALLLVATAIGLLLIKWKPKNVNKQRQQLRIVKALAIVGGALFFTAHFAGYTIVNKFPLRLWTKLFKW